ncbi:MAG: DNA polymerase I, partial [Oscillospiraceae bacterium]|nr:DNA polymerase I [Oscillospiraceae bacterium]
QVEPLKKLLTLLGYPIVSLEGYEADDILGTFAAMSRENGGECVIATGDRDSFQLVGDGVTVRLAYTRAGTSGAEMIDEAAIMEKYGVSPRQLIDVKALMGDSSDNIPGVAGIGEKTALALIQNFKSLDGVYENIEDPSIKKGARQKLIDGRDSANMSRELAIINCAVPLKLTLDDIMPAPRDDDGLYRLLEKLELRSMITRLGLEAPADISEPEKPVSAEPAKIVGFSLNDAATARNQFNCSELFAIIRYEKEIPVSMALLGESCVLLDKDCPDFSAIVIELAKFAPNLTLTDSKEWFRYLYNNNIDPENIKYDPVLAGYLLSPLAPAYDIEALCFGREISPYSVTLPDNISEENAALVKEIALLPSLCEQQKAELAEKEMEKLLYDIEQPLARVLASMETIGFVLDDEGLREYGEELTARAQELTQRIYYLAGGEFNVNSPKQLGEVLFEWLGLPTGKKTKKGYSTNADTLESLRNKHPIIEDIIAYRKLAKLISTYVEGLLNQLDDDGRVRSRFRQTETRTGRISSSEPNLQNIPVRTELGSRMRRFFKAPEGFKLVDADYSQIELRVLAHISDDPAMLAAFESGEDIHTKTAAQVFDMPEAFVTPQMRSSAKAVNFGIVYGIGAFSLARDIGVSVAEADRYIKSYLATYKGVEEYMKDTIAFGKSHGYVKTLFNRRRPVAELVASNHITRAAGERIAMNTPIQGTAADIIKLAMVRVFERLKKEKLRSRLILQVHDELIVEAPDDEAEKVAAILAEEMESAVSLKVKMPADSNIGDNWLEAK